jgi:Glycosyltransferase family 87
MIPRILLLPAVGLLLVTAKPGFFQPRDFVEYWSAARVLATGGDPYDAAQLLPIQRVANDDPTQAKVVSLWTPPWTLPVYRPFGFEPFAVARPLWIALQLLLIAVSVELLWRTYGGSPGVPALLPHLLAAGFAPVFWTVFFGQNTGLLLLGLSGFLYFRTHDRPYLAGGFAALTALKPHVLAAFGVVLVLDAVSTAGRKALAAGVAVIAAGAVAAVAMNPDIFDLFLAALRKPSTPEAYSLSDWQVPLASYHLRRSLDAGAFWIQFVPCLGLCAAAVPYYWLRRRTWDWRAELPRLVLASALLAPYGAWIFDLTVLLVPVIAGGVAVARSGPGPVWKTVGGLYLVLFLAGVQPLMLEQFIWFAPAVAGLWAWVAMGTVTPIGEPAGGFRVRISPPASAPS